MISHRHVNDFCNFNAATTFKHRAALGFLMCIFGLLVLLILNTWTAALALLTLVLYNVVQVLENVALARMGMAVSIG